MVKRLLPLALFAFSLHAQESFIALKYGLTSLNNDGVDFNNNSFEADLTVNGNYNILPRLGLAYVSIDEKGESVSSLLQLTAEGLYDVEIESPLTPYLFGGGGYEHVSNARKNFDSQFFIDAGAGVRYPLNDRLKLVSELKTLYMLGGNNQDSELVWYIGLGMPIGSSEVAYRDSDGDGVLDSADACPNTPYNTSVDSRGCPIKAYEITADSDHDAVPDNLDSCPHTPVGTPVDINGCPIAPQHTAHNEAKIKKTVVKDSDGDGIEDRLDKCPNTPKGFSVTSSGCPVKKRLEVHFDADSAVVTFASRPKIRAFADYIKHYPNAYITVVGYTDTSGSREKNRILSQKRAQNVRRLLIEFGLKPSHIDAIGKGELNPIAPNDTPEGREKNRRIEVIIH